MKGKKRVFGPKKPAFLAEFSLADLGGTPPPPLTDNHCAQKSLAERGGSPPPLTEKICWVVFEGFLKTLLYLALTRTWCNTYITRQRPKIRSSLKQATVPSFSDNNQTIFLKNLAILTTLFFHDFLEKDIHKSPFCLLIAFPQEI